MTGFDDLKKKEKTTWIWDISIVLGMKKVLNFGAGTYTINYYSTNICSSLITIKMVHD